MDYYCIHENGPLSIWLLLPKDISAVKSKDKDKECAETKYKKRKPSEF